MFTGSCLCGAVKFTVEAISGPFELCHCNRCRKVSGSNQLAGVGVKTADYTLISGHSAIKSCTLPLLEQPPAYTTYFCSHCGSPTPQPEPTGDFIEIPAGLFDDPLPINPDKHIYVEFSPDWDTIGDILPKYTKRQLTELRKK